MRAGRGVRVRRGDADRPKNIWRYEFVAKDSGTDVTESFDLGDNLFTKVWRPLGGFLRSAEPRDMLRTLERVKAVAEARPPEGSARGTIWACQNTPPDPRRSIRWRSSPPWRCRSRTVRGASLVGARHGRARAADGGRARLGGDSRDVVRPAAVVRVFVDDMIANGLSAATGPGYPAVQPARREHRHLRQRCCRRRSRPRAWSNSGPAARPSRTVSPGTPSGGRGVV